LKLKISVYEGEFGIYIIMDELTIGGALNIGIVCKLMKEQRV
jgi:hypothetical protein